MWQETTDPFVAAGDLHVVSVVQEQHPDRAKLYRQWRRLRWPIFVDSLNVLDFDVVPIAVAIDESGIVRDNRITPDRFAKRFMAVDYPPSAAPASRHRAADPDMPGLLKAATSANTARAWRDYGDACFLRQAAIFPEAKDGSGGSCDPIEAYQKAIELDPDAGRAQFRLGVALRRRYESDNRQSGDAQSAVEHWGRALGINPNQYIWRRRIQQYGPRLDKPYNFYAWVAKARDAIRARGEKPIRLGVEPEGSELAPPTGRSNGEKPATNTSRDPAGRVRRDTKGLVQIEHVVTPARVKPGHRVRVRMTLRPNPKTQPYWNNEADDLAAWVDLVDGLAMGDGRLVWPNPVQPETQEQRAVEFELIVPRDAEDGIRSVPVHAVYYVCEARGGKCFYLRQDTAVRFHVDPQAPTIR